MKNKLLLAIFILVPYAQTFGQVLDLSGFDTINLSSYFNCNQNFDTLTFAPPPEEYIDMIVNSTTGDIPVSSRTFSDDNYLFPVTVNYGGCCERIIVTANALYDSYGKENGMDLNKFKVFLKSTLLNNDTLLFDRKIPRPPFSANYTIISYNYPDYLYFKDDPLAFIRHYFPSISCKYYFCFDDKQACVVERLYYWGILVSDAAGTEDVPHFFISQSDLVRLARLLPESDKEKRWKKVFQNKKTRCDGVLD